MLLRRVTHVSGLSVTHVSGCTSSDSVERKSFAVDRARGCAREPAGTRPRMNAPVQILRGLAMSGDVVGRDERRLWRSGKVSRSKCEIHRAPGSSRHDSPRVPLKTTLRGGTKDIDPQEHWGEVLARKCVLRVPDAGTLRRERAEGAAEMLHTGESEEDHGVPETS